MDKVKARMISYIKGQDEIDFQKIVYLGEEVVLNLKTRRNFKFNSDEGLRIVRLNFEDNLRIKESINDVIISIRFEDNNFGIIKYEQKNMSMEMKCRLLDFKNSSQEIFIHYVIVDDLLNKLSESKLYFKIGE